MAQGFERMTCRWSFVYRDVSANKLYDQLVNVGLSCLTDPGDMQQDDSVNHPDSYAAQLFDLDRARLTVSLKDKAATQNSHVFLHVTSVP